MMARGPAQPRPGAAPIRRTRAPSGPRKPQERYSVKIERWEWDFLFGLHGGDPGDPYLDGRSIDLFGTVEHPPKLEGLPAEVSLNPDQQLNWPDRRRNKPTAIGVLNVVLRPRQLK